MDLIRNSGLDPIPDGLLVELKQVGQLLDRQRLPLDHPSRLTRATLQTDRLRGECFHRPGCSEPASGLDNMEDRLPWSGR